MSNSGAAPSSDSDSETPSDESITVGESRSLEELILEASGQRGLIRNPDLLDPQKIVSRDRIVGRDSQMRELIDKLSSVVDGRRPPHLLLYGPSGTGKTLIIKTICDKLKTICTNRDIEFSNVYLNCEGPDTLGTTYYALASKVAGQADVELNVPEYGIATNKKRSELLRLINEYFDSMIFVLDELDMLTGRRDKKEPAFSRLLYHLTRPNEVWNRGLFDTNLSLVVISNDTRVTSSVGSRAQSTFDPEEIHFPDYDANQLQAILRNRKDAFYPDALSNDVIPLTSAFAAQTHGDARKAINLMRVAGKMAERENAELVKEKHVRSAQDKVEKNRVLEVVRGVSSTKQLCLFASAAVATESISNTAKSPVAYTVYEYVTDALDMTTYLQETFVNNLKELATYSLVGTNRRSDGPDSGVYLDISFQDDPERILQTLRENDRLEQISPHELREVVRSNR